MKGSSTHHSLFCIDGGSRWRKSISRNFLVYTIDPLDVTFTSEVRPPANSPPIVSFDEGQPLPSPKAMESTYLVA